MKKYSLRYLPIAQQDLLEIILFGMLLLMMLWKFVEFCIPNVMKKI